MQYDLAIVGGGLGGAALAFSMTRSGARVIIVEQQGRYRDRIRGEVMHSWGVAEAVELGIYQHLVGTCGHETRYWASPAGPRDLATTTPSGLGCLNFVHSEMQQCLLDLAIDAGVDLRRPAEVIGVETGCERGLIIRTLGVTETVRARLVVGADGRDSLVARWAGLVVRRDRDCRAMAGALHYGLNIPEDTVRANVDYATRHGFVIVPVGGRRFRTYLFFPHDTPPLSGRGAEASLFDGCIRVGAPEEWFCDAESIGPLATFNCADLWVDHPYREGVALIGDAAASTDPTHGSGLSLTLRDVRVLRDCLLANADWDDAAEEYARQHDQYRVSLHRLHWWLKDIANATGPDGDALRAAIAADPSRRPDIIGLGPDWPSDEATRRRIFAPA